MKEELMAKILQTPEQKRKSDFIKTLFSDSFISNQRQEIIEILIETISHTSQLMLLKLEKKEIEATAKRFLCTIAKNPKSE